MFLRRSRVAVAVYGREDSSWIGGNTSWVRAPKLFLTERQLMAGMLSVVRSSTTSGSS